VESLKSVSKKTGYSYASLRLYVKKYEKELKDEGVLVVKEMLSGFKRYYVTDPDKFIETLKRLIREGKNG